MKRHHKSLGNRISAQAYQSASGIEARIVDKNIELKAMLKNGVAPVSC